MLAPLPGAALPGDVVAPNDHFASAAPVAALPFSDARNPLVSTTEPFEPLCADAERTLWYSYTPSQDVTVTLEAGERDFPNALALYTGDRLETLQQLSCSESEPVTLRLSGGTRYFVQLGARGTLGRRFRLSMRSTGAIAGRITDEHGSAVAGACARASRATDAPGDGAARAATAAADGRYVIRGLDAGEYVVEFACGGDLHTGEWYAGSPTRDAARPVTVVPGETTSHVDGRLTRNATVRGRLTGPAGEPARACAQGYATDGRLLVTVWPDADGSYLLPFGASGEYRIRFGCSPDRYEPRWWSRITTGGQTDTVLVRLGEDVHGIDATLVPRAAPENDAFANAIPLRGFPATSETNLVAATTEPGEPRPCHATAQRTVWYRFTADATRTVLVTAEADRFFTPRLGVYTGTTLADLRPVACDGGNVGRPSATTFHADPGEIYYLQIGSQGGGGDLTLTLAEAAGATSVAFTAPVPCFTACPYWTGGLGQHSNEEAACRPSPAAPPGSWDDRIVTIPGEVDGRVPRLLVFRLTPAFDSDSWACRVEPDADGNHFITTGGNAAGAECLMGCVETVVLRVRPGERYVLRVYNWSDGPIAEGQYAFALAG